MLIETTSPAASSVGDCIIEDGAAGGAPDKTGEKQADRGESGGRAGEQQAAALSGSPADARARAASKA
jgi:hypothetical protein